MLNRQATLNRVFQALADPARRRMVDRLSRGPTSVSELARPLTMTLPAVMQHLQVLEASGLVKSRKAGRVRTCRLAPRPLREVVSWMEQYRRFWEERFRNLDAYLLELQREERRHGPEA